MKNLIKFSMLAAFASFCLCSVSWGQASLGGTAKLGGTATLGTGVAAAGPIVCVQGGAGCTTATTTANGASNAATVTFTFPGNVTAGHTVVALVSSFHQPTGVSGGSDTLTQAISSQYAATGQYVSIYYKCSSTGGYTVLTVALPAGSYVYGSALELSGTPSSGCLDGSAISNTGTSTTVSTGALTPTVSGDAFVALDWNANNVGTLSWAGATSLFGSAANNEADGAYIISTGSSAQTANWTIASANWVAALAAFKP